jgi:hypothetical protein
MESLGRRIVMETGFSAVHERFERTYGKRITDFILGLIGLATIVACCAAIWALGLGPIVGWLSPLLLKSGLALPLLKVLIGVTAFVGGYGLAAYVGRRIERQLTSRSVRNVRAARRRLTRDQEMFTQRVLEFEERLRKIEQASNGK